MSLRKLVKNTLATLMGVNKAKETVLNVMREHNAIQSYDITKASSLQYNELFDPSVNKIYFSVLSKIVINNFTLFSNIFEGTSMSELQADFDIINKARRVPDHSYTESSCTLGLLFPVAFGQSFIAVSPLLAMSLRCEINSSVSFLLITVG